MVSRGCVCACVRNHSKQGKRIDRLVSGCSCLVNRAMYSSDVIEQITQSRAVDKAKGVLLDSY